MGLFKPKGGVLCDYLYATGNPGNHKSAGTNLLIWGVNHPKTSIEPKMPEMRKINVLFVCLGNICRSPLAEAIFKAKVREQGLEDHIYVESCGTANYHVGRGPDSRTIENALTNGVTIDHLGRQLTINDLDRFDYILAMDASNYTNIFKLPNARKHEKKIRLMRTFDTKEPGSDVPDPYYGGLDGFQEVFDILDRSTEQLLVHLREERLS